MQKHTFLKTIVLVAAGLIIVAAIIGFVLHSRYKHNENATKEMLQSEISTLPIPPDCTEQSRSYHKAQSKIRSGWTVIYKCQGATGAPAHKTVTDGLKKQGYVRFSDYSVPNDFITYPAYNFTYHDKTFHVDYSFGPPVEVDAAHVEKLHKSTVKEVRLDISRALKEYPPSRF